MSNYGSYLNICPKERVMLQTQTILQHFYKLFCGQLFIGSYLDPAITSLFLITNNHVHQQFVKDL